MRRLFFSILMIRLVCDTKSLKWEWADGSVLDYKPSSYDYLLDKDCNTLRTWVIQYNGYWDAGEGHVTHIFDIFCTTQLKQMVPVEDSCERYEDDSEDGICYQVGASSESWRDAQMNCKKLGANLASIHNAQENEFLSTTCSF
ncbi:hypothetical protein PENTCL1PPCAC_21440 [Pristionchus entomophagus]|uniref:C-type lectin domain-containing protein n=1 Tax=Pristionchus entomophagus TaxID=358040 RepID=A0AAV5TXJ4_9BILA|nr:hypothetical protein PENTCL1PPCAC_21440 [Pristionchus entomophagus]